MSVPKLGEPTTGSAPKFGEPRRGSPSPSEGRVGSDTPSASDEAIVFRTEADLDLPGETGRQARVFAVWLVCLALAVIGASVVGAHVATEDDGTPRAARELSRSRAAKAKVALVLGLALPILLTVGLNARHRRGGGHARGIVVDVTGDGELRIWGRGYGTRVAMEGAEVRERLVDVYAGRLGAWRQRRLRVRGAAKSGGRDIEIATPARRSDMEEALSLEGGEGDCVEIPREAYDRLRDLLTRPAARDDGGDADRGVSA